MQIKSIFVCTEIDVNEMTTVECLRWTMEWRETVSFYHINCDIYTLNSSVYDIFARNLNSFAYQSKSYIFLFCDGVEFIVTFSRRPTNYRVCFFHSISMCNIVTYTKYLWTFMTSASDQRTLNTRHKHFYDCNWKVHRLIGPTCAVLDFPFLSLNSYKNTVLFDSHVCERCSAYFSFLPIFVSLIFFVSFSLIYCNECATSVFCTRVHVAFLKKHF